MNCNTVKYVYASVNGIRCKFEADSGSDINLFPKNRFTDLCRELGYTPKLQKSSKKVRAANKSEIKCLGFFEATISSRYASIVSKVYVMEQSQDDYPLLSRYDLHTLGFIKVDPEGAYATNKVYSENDLSDEEFAAEVTKLHKKYAKVFIGVGTYKHHTVDLYHMQTHECCHLTRT